MKPILSFEELAIAVIAPNLHPTLLTPEFLKARGIVPSDWKLAEPPIVNSHMARITFANGAIASVHNHSATFSQTLKGTTRSEIKVPEIVGKYADSLSNTDYQAVEINPSIFLTFEDGNENLKSNYIPTVLLTSGAWLEFGSTPVTATLQLAYTVGGRQLNLKIDDVKMRGANNKLEFAALFSGNFSYPIAGKTREQRRQHLHQLIDNWLDDLDIFRELVLKRFFSIL